MEKLSRSTAKSEPNGQTYEITDANTELTEGAVPSEGVSQTPNLPQHNPVQFKNLQKVLLPKPKVALVNVPVVQLAQLPVLLPSAETGALRSVVLAVDAQGSLSTLQLVPQTLGAVVPALNTNTMCFKDTMPVSRSTLDPVSTGIQVNLESLVSVNEPVNDLGYRSKITSTNIQTDISFHNRGSTGAIHESSVSSSSQTDISVSAQIQLPVSVQTQTFPVRARVTSSIGAQTDSLNQLSLPGYNRTRETQTLVTPVTRAHMDQAITCTNLFDTDMLSVSTQTALDDGTFITDGLNPDPIDSESGLFEDKTHSSMCSFAQRAQDILQPSTVADNQTQTMTLFSDLENILSDSMASEAPSCGSGLVSAQEQHTEIDFDFEEFLNATHIQTQTQTDESALGGLSSETPLELLDIETQTDFFLLDKLGDSHQSDVGTRVQPGDLELEMFDTQTQTDLNFLLNPGNHTPLGSILRHSSFNMSTESSDNETQTDSRPSPFSVLMSSSQEGQTRLSSTETQTVSKTASLGHLFLTSNETQTVMDDFLSADLAWNVESHFSSVETQTSEDLFSLFQHSEKSEAR